MDERSVDETLRMIARMPAPEGLEERVKAGLQLAETPKRVLRWPTVRHPRSANAASVGAASAWARTGWARAGWARGAAAAAIALVVAGGGWGIYSRVEPAQSAKTGALPQPQQNGATQAGAFGEAGAMRRPLTLTGPKELHLAAPKVEQPVPQTNAKKAGAAPTASDAAKAHASDSASKSTAPAQ
jgi:hypothetical protein